MEETMRMTAENSLHCLRQTSLHKQIPRRDERSLYPNGMCNCRQDSSLFISRVTDKRAIRNVFGYHVIVFKFQVN